MEFSLPPHYRDRVTGGWAGKCLGGAIGMCYEGVPYQPELTPEAIAIAEVPNDDLELQLVWLLALERHGLALTAAELVPCWLEHIRHGCDEYSIAIRNLRRGTRPPESGRQGNFFADGMGAAIRSEIWALVFAGRPDAAGYFAEQDAVIDHWGDGVWSEIFLATAESRLFVERDIAAALRYAWARLPADCRLARALATVFALHDRQTPVEEAKQQILRTLSHPNFTDCVMNLSFIAYALLWGGGDFVRTILLAINCGRDTDCTGASCGAFLGICHGTAGIPAWLLDKLSPKLLFSEFIAQIPGLPPTLPELVERTVALHERLFAALPAVPYPRYQPCAPVRSAAADASRWLVLDAACHDIPAIRAELMRTGVCPENLRDQVVAFDDLQLELSEYACQGNTLVLMSFLTVEHSETAVDEIVLSATADVGMTVWLEEKRLFNHHARLRAIPSFHRAEGGAAFACPLAAGTRQLMVVQLYSCLPPLRCTVMFGNQYNDHLEGFRFSI